MKVDIKVDTDKLLEKRVDKQGRFYIGRDYIGKDVEIAIVEVSDE